MDVGSGALLELPPSVCLSVSGNQECGRVPHHCGCAHLASAGRVEVSGLVGSCPEEPGLLQRWTGCVPTSDMPREGSRGDAEPGPRSVAGTLVQGSFPPSARLHPAPRRLENVSRQPGTVEVSSSSILLESTYPPHDPRSQLLSLQDQPAAGGTCPHAAGHPQYRCWGRGCCGQQRHPGNSLLSLPGLRP